MTESGFLRSHQREVAERPVISMATSMGTQAGVLASSSLIRFAHRLNLGKQFLNKPFFFKVIGKSHQENRLSVENCSGKINAWYLSRLVQQSATRSE